jgi:hypothetical protein
MQIATRFMLQAILVGGLCFFLVACAPVQPAPAQEVVNTAPRDWFTQSELETALIAAGVDPAQKTAGLCSADPAQPEHYSVCVQYGPDGAAGAQADHYWWVARWDQAGQRVIITWQSNVEVQLQ